MGPQYDNEQHVAADRSSSPIELYYSNLNSPPKDIALGGVRRLNSLLEMLQEEDETLFQGIEVTPTRRLLLDYARLPTLRAGAIHQPWAPRATESIKQGWPSVQAMVFGLGATAIMPVSEVSLNMLSKQSQRLGGIPAIVYADQTRDGQLIDYTAYNFVACETQVSPELMAAYPNKGSFEPVRDSLIGRGITGLVIDSHHIARVVPSSGYPLNPTVLLNDINAAQMPISRIHVSAGRIDSEYEVDGRRTRAELGALLNGASHLGRTAMNDTLAQAYDIWRDQQGGHPTGKLPVTVEVPFSGLNIYRNFALPENDFVTIHREMAHTIHSYFASLV